MHETSLNNCVNGEHAIRKGATDHVQSDPFRSGNQPQTSPNAVAAVLTFLPLAAAKDMAKQLIRKPANLWIWRIISVPVL